jgi:hypothetical protein
MCDGFLNKKKIRVIASAAHITTLNGNARVFVNLREKKWQILKPFSCPAGGAGRTRLDAPVRILLPEFVFYCFIT